ncbi:NAD(P)/FAD-dependent oxidoreductase [Granulosicoccus antarcticus]|uniref:D-amino acid dehydrogenase 1 n=1 Tax=Granulosicoccus antarcticus IMCC3135 TaxID=1192854 RepID=A0A2Z2NQL9_9GAMM|nr:FAD-dependent oxidoreductase [Granulosicoccus antarcticus]ASJ73682.1 D-amino acid dehydrogenase 1 [Granulosicoccus antarcticus IMCC3135]
MSVHFHLSVAIQGIGLSRSTPENTQGVSMSEFLVLGAGIVGISTALELQSRGHSVVVVDRTSPGLETSYGNAGVIQGEAAEPYLLPRNLPTLVRMALGMTNDLSWSSAGILANASALWKYYRFSETRRHREISQTYAQLTSSATADHASWITAAQADDLITRDGFSCVYKDARAFDAAAQEMDRLCTTYKLKARLLTGTEYAGEEPALTGEFAGAIHWHDSWTCSDPGRLTQLYADLFVTRGGEIRTGDASSLKPNGSGWSVDTIEGVTEASSVVIALGPWAPQTLKRFGYKIPMVLKRGYHGHFNAPVKLQRPILDVANGVVASSMVKGLRITTGVALVPQNEPANPSQLIRGAKGLAQIMELGDRVEEPQWYGTRPFMPDMLPVVGKAPKHSGMWFNFGHGHHGLTLGPTTARLLADAIEAQTDTLPVQSKLDPQRLF